MRRQGVQIGIFLGVAALSVGCDHAAKFAAVEWLQGSGVHEFFGGLVRFELAHNPGAFMSLGASFPPWVRRLLLVGAVPLALVALCASFLRSGSLTVLGLVALGLVAGGGGGNWLDRLADGTVTDFVRLEYAGLRTGIFNIADVAILAGVGLLLFSQRTAARAEEVADTAPGAAGGAGGA